MWKEFSLHQASQIGAETLFSTHVLVLRKTILHKYLQTRFNLSSLKCPLFGFPETMDQKIPYDDYQLPVVFLPSYENPPAWIPPHEVQYFLLHEAIKNKRHVMLHLFCFSYILRGGHVLDRA